MKDDKKGFFLSYIQEGANHDDVHVYMLGTKNVTTDRSALLAHTLRASRLGRRSTVDM